MKNIQRTTEVISVSLPKNVAQKLEQLRKMKGQSRSSFIASVIIQLTEEERWQAIYTRGKKTAQRFGITSEDDIERIVHEAAS